MGELATKFALTSDDFQKFFLGKFVESQLKAGNSEKYYQFLTYFEFIYLKIQHPQFGVEPLIRDYYLIDNPEILNGLEEEEKLDPKQVKTLKLIQRTLELSEHVLNQDPNQLVGQLWGRLQSFPQPEIQKILADAQQSKSEIPRFRPITASLTTPNGNLLRTLTGHNSYVRAVAMPAAGRANAPDGKTAVSASADKTLKQWNLETGKEISTLTGHNDYVTAVAMPAAGRANAPDGKTAVSASFDKTLKLWDLQTGQEIFTLTGHNDSVNAVAIAPDGKTAVSASDDNTLKVWDLETGKEIFTLTGHNDWVRAVAIAPDGKTAVSASDDNTLKAWDLETGKEIFTLTGHNNYVRAAAIAPDGKTAVSASDDKTLRLWDLQTNKEIQEIKKNSFKYATYIFIKRFNLLKRKKISTLTRHNNYVMGVAIAPDGKTAVSASNDNTLKLWDLQTGKEISFMKPLIAILIYLNHTSKTKIYVETLHVTPPPVVYLLENCCNLLKRKKISTLTRHNSYVMAVAITLLENCCNLLKGKKISTLTGHNSYAMAVAIAPDGKKAVSSLGDGTLKLLALEIGKEISIISTFISDSPIGCCAFSPDGLTIVAGESSGRVHFLRLEGEDIE